MINDSRSFFCLLITVSGNLLGSTICSNQASLLHESASRCCYMLMLYAYIYWLYAYKTLYLLWPCITHLV